MLRQLTATLLLFTVCLAQINQSNTGVWQNNTLTNTPSPRTGAASITTEDNIWYVFGGRTANSYLNDLYKLDMKNPSEGWSKVETNNTPAGRFYHSATLIKNKIYVFGGMDSTSKTDNDMHVLDLSESPLTWVSKSASSAKSPTFRYAHSAVAYKDKIFIFGGNTAFGLLQDSWQYDPESNQWTQIDAENAPAPRYGQVTSLYENKMFIFGGYSGVTIHNGKIMNDTWCLDLDSSKWTQVKTKPSESTGKSASPRMFASSATVKENLWIFGGTCTDDQGNLTSSNDMWVLSHEGDAWSEAINIRPKNTPAGRHSSVTTVSPGTQAVNVLGGANENTIFGDAWFFILLQ